MRVRTADLLIAGALIAGCGAEDQVPALDVPDVFDGGTGELAPPDADRPSPDGCVPSTVFPDADRDGHGDPARPLRVCDGVPEGHVTLGNDCDDTCSDCSPVSPERCDGMDNDCNGMIDDGLDAVTVYPDADGDGFGVAGAADVTCGDVPEGFVLEDGDCDDDDPAVSPAATETCNAIDDDCNSLVDEGLLAPRGSAVALGEVESTFRQLSLAPFTGGWVAVWADPGHRVRLAVLQSDGLPTGEVRLIDPASEGQQGTPVVAVIESAGSARALVAWAEDGRVVRARSVALAGGQLSEVRTLSASTDVARMPLQVIVTGADSVVLWLERRERQETRGRVVDPATALPLAPEALLYSASRADPDNFGPTATTIAADPDAFFLGVADRGTVGSTTVGYVQRVEVRPELAPVGAPTTLVPRDGAARRVVLVPADADSVLALVTRGLAPDEESDVFRVDLPVGDSPRVTTMEDEATGMVIAATGGPAGADVILSDVLPTRRRALGLGLCSLDGAHHSGGLVASLLTPWASVARVGPTEGAVLYAGRVSDTDVTPDLWLRRYGCE